MKELNYRSKYTTKDVNSVIDMIVVSGMSTMDVKRKTGISCDTIRRWLKSAGIPVRSRQFGNRKIYLDADTIYQIIFLYENFYSIHEIAEIISQSYNLVRSTLIEQKVPIRDRFETMQLAFARLKLIKMQELKRLKRLAKAGDDSAIRRHISDIERLRQEEEKRGLPSKEDFDIKELSRLLAG